MVRHRRNVWREPGGSRSIPVRRCRQDGGMRSIDLDLSLAGLARRQHGVVSRRQVLDAGGSDRMIANRLSSGRWIRLDAGVYALVAAPATWQRALMAAQLSEPVAAIAGRSAAELNTF